MGVGGMTFEMIALCVAVVSLLGSTATLFYARSVYLETRADLAEFRAKLAANGVTQPRQQPAAPRMPLSLYDRRPEET